MSYFQVIAPKLNTPARLGMCLEYAQNAFGSGWAGEYALDGWNRNTQFNHADRSIPSGVFVPIWFDGYWTGVRYGHVAIYKDGVVYSSPWTKANAAIEKHDVLGSIADVERIYRMTYIGWSEGIGGLKVIGKEDGMNSDHVATLFQFMRGGDPNKDEIRFWTGRQAEELIDVLKAQPSASDVIKDMEIGRVARKDDWQGQINALRKESKELSKTGTVLKVGTYIVK